jgi:hypothetical protein
LLDFLAYRDSLRAVGRNALSLAENLPLLCRSAIPGEFTAATILVWLGCLIGPILLFWACFRRTAALFGRGHKAHPCPPDFIGDVLLLSTVLCITAYLASSIPKDRTTARYLVPVVLCGSVTGSRVLAERAVDLRKAVVALAVLGASYAVTVRNDLRKLPATDHAVQLADTLAVHGLRYGYGPFWDASIVTASSRGRVAVRPLYARAVSPERHRMVPLPWMTDARWFIEEPATFVVLEPGPGAAYQFGLTERNCQASFGPIAGRFHVGPHTVLVWDHELRPQLDN